MSENIQNLFITSSNKNNNTNYNYTIYLSNYNIKIREDEEAYFSINSFMSLNSFYNINEKSNSFTIRIRNDMDMTFFYNFTIEQGNYDIYQFMTQINEIAGTYINITYDEKKNRYRYTSTQPLNIIVYIKPTKYNYKYFGLNPDEYTEVLTEEIISNKYSDIINMNNFSLIIIKVIGLLELTKTIDNFNKTINTGDIAAIINRQDSAVNSLINWININNNYKKRILNNEINELTFQFYNENNEYLTDLNDWVITLSIITKPKK